MDCRTTLLLPCLHHRHSVQTCAFGDVHDCTMVPPESRKWHRDEGDTILFGMCYKWPGYRRKRMNLVVVGSDGFSAVGVDLGNHFRRVASEANVFADSLSLCSFQSFPIP